MMNVTIVTETIPAPAQSMTCSLGERYEFWAPRAHSFPHDAEFQFSIFRSLKEM